MNRDVFIKLEEAKDCIQSEKMSAYMKNKFIFLGLPKPKLMAIIKPYLKESKKEEIDWDFVYACFEKEYREAQYLGIEYLNGHIKQLTKDDFYKIKTLIITKSWWETVDSLDSIVGVLAENSNEVIEEILLMSKSDNIWLRRTAIDFQLKYKEKTNTSLLEEIITNNFNTNEFFIDKAIGWSLREYSKTNKEWVRDFIEKYKDKLSALSIKEGSKYIE